MATETVFIDTSKVRGRRKLRFASHQEVIDEICRLRDAPHRQLGNWNLAMIAQHLANAINASMEGGTFRVKWYLKLVGPWVVKPMLVKGPFPAGFKLPRSASARLVAAPDARLDAALDELRQAIDRLLRDTRSRPHPVAGSLTAAEWVQFHLRHAEMHLSFLIPEARSGGP